MTQVKKNTVNYGFALLKSFMCFIVILCHCWTTEVPRYLLPFAVLKPYAVPVFMFLSFYLTQKSIMHKDKGYALQRIWKIILPQILWALIYFIVYWLVGVLTNRNLVTGISALFWQIFTGHSPQLNPTMWFQVDLIIITVLFFLIFHFCHEKVGIILIILLSTVCFFAQYSGINYNCFGIMRYELSYPLGRLSETIPAAAFGFISAKYKLLEPLKNNRFANLLIAFLSSCLFIVLHHFEILVPAANFGYAGLWLVFFAYTVAMFAFNLNFDFLNEKAKHALSFITRYTLGIYCGHRLVAFFVFNIFSICFGVSEERFYQCIIIYLVNFILCWIVSKLPVKWIKNIV